MGASTWKPESIKALQAALEANRAHHRKVEALQYELDEQERTLSDDVRKKMAALREAVNARERELLADAQLQLCTTHTMSYTYYLYHTND